MLIHHSREDYGVAAAKAADWAVKKMEDIIQTGQTRLQETIEIIQKAQPQDHWVGSAALQFGADEKGFGVKFEGHDDRLSFHPHALLQVTERAGMPSGRKMIDWLNEDPEGPRWLADVMNLKYERQEQKKYLVRSVNQQVRGFLSNRYMPLRSPPIVKSFMEGLAEHGALPIKAQAFDTKFYIKTILPHVFEPLPGEVMLFGLSLKNSDFGDGKLEVAGFIHRLRCTNLMMTEDGFSRVHLGSVLGENVELSTKTIELQTEAACSATKDIVNNTFAPVYVRQKMERIKALSEEKVDADNVIEALRKASKLTKDEAKEVKKLVSSAEVEMLPAGQNMLRLVNAISLFGQQTDPERELELEVLAGEVAGLNSSN
jgi:hypothetical protein